MLTLLATVIVQASPEALWRARLEGGGDAAVDAVRQLADARAGVPLLIEALDRPPLAAEAALALGRIEDPSALPKLLEALDGPAAHQAVFAVGQLAVANPELALQVEARLFRLLDGPLVLAAWQALGRVGGEATISAALAEDAVRPKALVAAALCLARLGQAPDARWVALLDDRDAEVRAAALYAWARTAPGVDLAPIALALGRALSLGGAELVIAARVVRRHGVPPAVRAHAVAALQTAGPHEAVALVEGLRDPAVSRNVVLSFARRVAAGAPLVSPDFHAALAALASPADPEVLEALAALPAGTPPERRRRDALVCAAATQPETLDAACAGASRVERAVALMGAPAAGQGELPEATRRDAVVAPWLRDPLPTRRMAALEHTSDLAVVRGALADSDRPVVATACTRLAELAGNSPELGEVVLGRALEALAAGDDEAAIDCLKAAKALGALLKDRVPPSGLAVSRAAGLPLRSPPLPPAPRPAPGSAAPKEWVVETEVGDLTLRLDSEAAPSTVRHLSALACAGRYAGLRFHRVVPDFVVQTGDPRGDGWGGLSATIPCENNDRPFTSGAVGMALAGKDTGASQWFITHTAHPHLGGTYTNFGAVVDGFATLDRLAVGDAILRIRGACPR